MLKRCKACGSTDIHTDYTRGEFICANCGLVMSHRKPEWHAFTNETLYFDPPTTILTEEEEGPRQQAKNGKNISAMLELETPIEREKSKYTFTTVDQLIEDVIAAGQDRDHLAENSAVLQLCIYIEHYVTTTKEINHLILQFHQVTFNILSLLLEYIREVGQREFLKESDVDNRYIVVKAWQYAMKAVISLLGKLRHASTRIYRREHPLLWEEAELFQVKVEDITKILENQFTTKPDKRSVRYIDKLFDYFIFRVCDYCPSIIMPILSHLFKYVSSPYEAVRVATMECLYKITWIKEEVLKTHTSIVKELLKSISIEEVHYTSAEKAMYWCWRIFEDFCWEISEEGILQEDYLRKVARFSAHPLEIVQEYANKIFEFIGWRHPKLRGALEEIFEKKWHSYDPNAIKKISKKYYEESLKNLCTDFNDIRGF